MPGADLYAFSYLFGTRIATSLKSATAPLTGPLADLSRLCPRASAAIMKSTRALCWPRAPSAGCSIADPDRAAEREAAI